MPEPVVDFTGFNAQVERAEAQRVEVQRAAMQAEVARGDAEPTPGLRAAGALQFPPGFVGALAQFIYQQAPHPVMEVAVVAALGAMAGIAGRQWSISNTGLNIYMVLVARSGIGKEAMHTGIGKLISAAAVTCPEIRLSVETKDFASGPALVKGCIFSTCMLNLAGEIGHKFVDMAEEKGGGPMRGYRKVLTELFHKSGPGSLAAGIAYSDQEKNAESVDGVAFSLIGDSTPGRFYQSLTPTMMEDGFLSRFCVVEYAGEITDPNPAPLSEPSPGLVTHYCSIFRQAQSMRDRDVFQPVKAEPAAQAMLDSFRAECIACTKAAGEDEGQRQLWSRAHLKALRVSALMAVGDNPYDPTVTGEQASWAINLVLHGIAAFEKRLGTGDVGEGSDAGRERKVLEVCKDFLRQPEHKKFSELRKAGIIPRSYIQTRTQRVAAFYNHKLGATGAMGLALRSAVANGHLIEIKRRLLVENFGYHGDAYRLVIPT